MRYKAGDKVWCLVSKDHNRLPPGAKLAAVVHGPASKGNGPPPYYFIDIEGYPAHNALGFWSATEQSLFPRFDDYDGDKAGEWDLCPWKPGKTREDQLVDDITKFKERVNK